MATRIEVPMPDGSKQIFESTFFTGYHLKKAEDGYCIVEKSWFQDPKVVLCVQNAKEGEAKQENCPVCELLNPSQQL